MGLKSSLDLSGKSVLFVQSAQSQLDACFYSELSNRVPGRVLVAIMNDGGATRREVDPELGLIPQFPELETGYSTVHFRSERSGGLKSLLKLILSRRPGLVVVQDQSWVAKLVISAVTRFSGGKVAMRSDKNSLSHNAREGLPHRLECLLVNFAFNLLAPVSDLTREYYQWRRTDWIVPFPYPSSAKKFRRNADCCASRVGVRRKLGIPDDSQVFLVVAKFVERENVAGVIAAFSRVVAISKDAHLIVVGSGPLETKLRELVRELGLFNVHFTGYMPYENLQETFWASDIFVHLARIEPWGVSPQDALVACMKLVTSDRVGSGVVHLQGDLGRFLVRHDDPDEAAVAMCLALDVPASVFEPAWRAVDASFTAEGLSTIWSAFLR